MTVIPYVAALLAALLNTTGDLLQRRSTRTTPSEEAGSYRLFLDLFRRPGWLLGLLASIVGLGVHIVALSLGELAAVQPLLVLELPLAVLGAAWLFGVRPSRRDWAAVALLALGLAAFVFSLHPEGGSPSTVPGTTWAIGLGVLGAIVAGLALIGWRSRRDLRAGLLGAAAGIGYGATAVLFSAARRRERRCRGRGLDLADLRRGRRRAAVVLPPAELAVLGAAGGHRTRPHPRQPTGRGDLGAAGLRRTGPHRSLGRRCGTARRRRRPAQPHVDPEVTR